MQAVPVWLHVMSIPALVTSHEGMQQGTVSPLQQLSSAKTSPAYDEDKVFVTRVLILSFLNSLIQASLPFRARGGYEVSSLWFIGLVGYHALGLMECLQRHVLQLNTTFVPFKAVVYCMGVEILTQTVQGFTFSALDKFRWSERSESVRLSELPHRKLTSPAKVFEFQLNGQQHGRGRETLVWLDVHEDGNLNAIVYWFDLYLDEDTIITTGTDPSFGSSSFVLCTAPRGISIGGKVDVSSMDVVTEMEPNDDQSNGSSLEAVQDSVMDSPNNTDGHHWGQVTAY